MTLVNLRKSRNLSQKEISKELQVNQNTYSQYETGKRTPSIEIIPKLSKILNCTIEELVFAIINTKGE